VKSGTGLWSVFGRASWELGRSIYFLVKSNLFAQKCFRAAHASYFCRDQRKRQMALDDLLCLQYVIRDSLPFLKSEKQEETKLLVTRIWIEKQVEAIEKVTENVRAGNSEVLERLREEGTVPSLKKVLESIRSGEVRSLAELYTRFGAYPGVAYLIILS